MSACISNQGEYSSHDYEQGECAACGHVDLNEVRAAAIEDAAEVFGAGDWNDAWMADAVDDDVTAVQSTVKWFQARAKGIRESAS